MSAGLQEKSRASTILKTRVYDRSALCESLNADLSEIRLQDQFAEKQQKLFGILTLVGIVVVILSLPTGAGIFVAASIVLFVLFLAGWIKWKGINLVDERYMLAEELLELFARDMNADAPITLRLGFEKMERNDNKVSIRRTDRNRFMYSWLTMSGQFCDGSKFSLRVAELLDVKFRKSKRKAKGYVVSLSLAFSKKSYGVLQLNGESAAKMVQVRGAAKLKSVKVKGNVLHISAKLPPLSSGGAEIITKELATIVKFLLLSAYAVVNSAMKSRDSSAS